MKEFIVENSIVEKGDKIIVDNDVLDCNHDTIGYNLINCRNEKMFYLSKDDFEFLIRK